MQRCICDYREGRNVCFDIAASHRAWHGVALEVDWQTLQLTQECPRLGTDARYSAGEISRVLNLYISIRNLFRQLSGFPPYLCSRIAIRSDNQKNQNDNEQDGIYHRNKFGIRQGYSGTLCGQRMERGGYGQEPRAAQGTIRPITHRKAL
jgi:hypothetical protein